jgi:hypothetical protein
MEPLSEDTPLPVERLWLAGLRARGPLWRLQKLVHLTGFCWQAAQAAFQRARPGASLTEREAWLFQERYSSAIPHRVLALCRQKGVDMTVHGELWDALLPVIDALAALAVPYLVGGSVASSAMGVVRATLDVDLVADLHLEHAEPLTVALAQDYYVDGDMIKDAIRRRGSFNVIHLPTMFKVDEWYDLQGVLRLQAEALDMAYMRRWADQLGLTALLDRALDEAGL